MHPPIEPLYNEIGAQISSVTGEVFEVRAHTVVAGGCINGTAVLSGAGRRYFVKINTASQLPMFDAESEGLAEIAATNTVRVPQPVCRGQQAGTSWLVLEHLELGSCRDDGAERLGHALASLHRVTAGQFGWRRDNTIGATPQINTPENNWVTFYGQQRLGYQLALAARNGFKGALQRKGERLIENLAAFFDNYRPAPSLLHGDLWGGNHACLANAEPVIFDPAVYYGDREADMAMTELFGGFDARFYAAYRDAWPLDRGYATRRALYNLYHVLNHANLFGGGYAQQAGQMLDRLLAEIR